MSDTGSKSVDTLLFVLLGFGAGWAYAQLGFSYDFIPLKRRGYISLGLCLIGFAGAFAALFTGHVNWTVPAFWLFILAGLDASASFQELAAQTKRKDEPKGQGSGTSWAEPTEPSNVVWKLRRKNDRDDRARIEPDI